MARLQPIHGPIPHRCLARDPGVAPPPHLALMHEQPATADAKIVQQPGRFQFFSKGSHLVRLRHPRTQDVPCATPARGARFRQDTSNAATVLPIIAAQLQKEFAAASFHQLTYSSDTTHGGIRSPGGYGFGIAPLAASRRLSEES